MNATFQAQSINKQLVVVAGKPETVWVVSLTLVSGSPSVAGLVSGTLQFRTTVAPSFDVGAKLTLTLTAIV